MHPKTRKTFKITNKQYIYQ